MMMKRRLLRHKRFGPSSRGGRFLSGGVFLDSVRYSLPNNEEQNGKSLAPSQRYPDFKCGGKEIFS